MGPEGKSLSKRRCSENTKELKEAVAALNSSLSQLQQLLKRASDAALRDSTRIDAVARDISFGIARIYCGALLVQAASDATGKPSDEYVAYR